MVTIGFEEVEKLDPLEAYEKYEEKFIIELYRILEKALAKAREDTIPLTEETLRLMLSLHPHTLLAKVYLGIEDKDDRYWFREFLLYSFYTALKDAFGIALSIVS